MCICCGILETLALCAGLKVLAVCKKKKCKCARPHNDSDKIEFINLNEEAEAAVCAVNVKAPDYRDKIIK